MNDSLVVVVGLKSEARIASGPAVMVVCGGGNRPALEASLSYIDVAAVQGVLSFGLAGALDRAAEIGALVVADGIVDPSGKELEADPALSASIRAALARGGIIHRKGLIAGSDVPLLAAAKKAALHAATGAAAVDMESHVAAAYAARSRLPFAALRVISDRADQVLPAVAGRAMRPDGSIDVLGIIAGLAREPAQIGPLIRTARDANAAFRQLRRVRSLLGDLGGLLGLDL